MPKQNKGYNPFERFEWVEYIEEGADPDAIPFRAKVRSNITFTELESMEWKTTDKDGKYLHPRDSGAWEVIAPYVVDWNLKGIDAKGKGVDLDPPAEGGAGQFEYIPPALFWALANDIKLRSVGRVDPKRLSRREPAAEPTNSTD